MEFLDVVLINFIRQNFLSQQPVSVSSRGPAQYAPGLLCSYLLYANRGGRVAGPSTRWGIIGCLLVARIPRALIVHVDNILP